MPTVLSMASMPVMTLVDRYFCGQLGVEQIAAAGNGGMIAWVPASAVMGIIGVVSTFVSQNFGAGRPRDGAAYAWNAAWFVAIVWCVLYLPLALFLPDILHAVRQACGAAQASETVAHLEVSYARVLIVGLIITLPGRALHQYFFGMHRTLIPLVGVLVGNVANVFLTWGLVLGRFGLPAWGVPGSAVANVVAATMELLIPLAFFLSPRYRHELGTHMAWRPCVRHIREILKLGWPAGLMFGSEMVCWGAFMTVLVAQFGPAHNAAGVIALGYMSLSFMPAVGMSNAVAAIVGKCIGAGRYDLAEHRTLLGIKVTLVYMTLCAAGFVVFRHPLAALLAGHAGHPGADGPEQVIPIASNLLILAATFQVFDAVGITIIGALRGAGDTLWPGVMTMFLSWTVIIGGGKALTVLCPQWESLGPWIAAAAYIILFALGVAWRWRSGAWRSIKVLHEPRAAPITAPADA